MEALARSDGHVSLRPRCGICGSSMEITERFDLLTLVLGDGDSTAYSQRLGPYIFPGYGHRIRDKSGVSLCRKPGCSLCAVAPEASVAHFDCFEFMAQRCNIDESLDYLWIVSAWRTPWRQAPQFCLEEKVAKPDWSVFDRLGISNMRLLPPEIVGMIRQYSATSMLWRLTTASELSRQLPAGSSGHLLSIPLCEVSAWKRGEQPVTADAAHVLSVVRLTIDSWGIREIERLPGNPSFRIWRADDLIFAILDQRLLQGINVHFKFGFSRLELPKTCQGLQTWDTPTPPDLKRCQFYPADIISSTQFRTIQLSRTSGITFFFCYGEIYAVHAHTRTAPYAQSTYQRMSHRRRQAVTWVYVPISKEDSITALGARMSLAESTPLRSTCLLFRMKLGGDVSVGLTSSKQARDLILSRSPMTMIYNVQELQPVSVIGAYPTGEDNSPLTRFRHPYIDDPPFPNACFSLASLEKINHMTVFDDKHTGLCMGILLYYQNGAQRALGQCRVGVDPVKDYAKPGYVCFNRLTRIRLGTSVQLQATIVSGGSSRDHDHKEEGWFCYEMQGELEFWFSHEETQLTVIADS
ncbi:hypothetical protein NM208_g4253 [Fusarium decemcellulare]|uniref:Uncharacterized protein n=1 Tax=Fusarium decemcellulare TaxID=57161 RepID=A0ACC1SLH7_9HYPO|nr:hypothetical protein NM208_g4253 [Fusarium decemcellulare]